MHRFKFFVAATMLSGYLGVSFWVYRTSTLGEKTELLVESLVWPTFLLRNLLNYFWEKRKSYLANQKNMEGWLFDTAIRNSKISTEGKA